MASGWFLRPSGSITTNGATPTGAVSYGPAVRTDLTQMQSFDGTLAYTADTTVVNRLSGSTGASSSTGSSSSGASSSGGTLTWAPTQGTVVRRGGALYDVDQQPVVLFYGAIPAYRTLQAGVSDGADVKQLEQNLKSLGFDDGGAMTVDDHFDSATTQAVNDWQTAIGATATGIVTLGEVVFLSGPVRVDQVLLPVGSSAGSGDQVLEVGSTAPIVTMSLSSNQLSLVKVGGAVMIELPDGSTTVGTVASIGAPSSSSSSQGSNSSSSIPITVSLDKPKVGQGLSGAAVTVDVVTDQRKDALAVPVTALLALQGGGYAVQVDRGGGRTEMVRVTPGLFDDAKGLVEITSAGLQPGDRVIVASS